MKNDDLYTIYDVVNFLRINCKDRFGVELLVNRDGSEYYNFFIYDEDGIGTMIAEQKTISDLLKYLVNDYYNTSD